MQSAFGDGARICKHLMSPGMASKELIPPAYVACAGIFEQSMGVRDRDCLYQAGTKNRVIVPAHQVTWAGRIDSFDSGAIIL